MKNMQAVFVWVLAYVPMCMYIHVYTCVYGIWSTTWRCIQNKRREQCFDWIQATFLWFPAGKAIALVRPWEHTCSFLQGSFIMRQMIQQIWRSNSHRMHQKISVLRVWFFRVLAAVIQSSNSKESARITWHFTARGVLFPSARWLYLGKSLSWKALFCWIDFKKYLYSYAHKLSLCDSGVWFF